MQDAWQAGGRAADVEIELVGVATAGGVVEPVGVGFATVDFADDGADMPPQAADARLRQHCLFGDGKAEATEGFGLHFRRQLYQAGEVFREQVQAGEAVKEALACIRGQFGDVLQFAGNAA